MNFVVAVNNFGDTRAGGLAGPMGLFIIVLMSIAVVLLIRNMNKRLRRLPDSFPDPNATRRDAEIARLDADPDRADVAPGRPAVDSGRLSVSAEAAEPEVSGVDPTDRPSRGGADQGNA